MCDSQKNNTSSALTMSPATLINSDSHQPFESTAHHHVCYVEFPVLISVHCVQSVSQSN